MMSPASLYRICLNRIYGFLKEGMWEKCIPNPFSELPTRDVDNLMELTQSSDDNPKIWDVILLLTSGKLSRLNLCPFHLEADDLAITAIQTRDIISFQNLGSHSKKTNAIRLVRNIISWNPYLKEFHLNIHPGFDVFRKCQNIRILRFYRSSKAFGNDSCFINLSVLSSLRNLEVLHVPHMDEETVSNVLEICPGLISVGLNDSLDGLEEIARKRLKNSSFNFVDGSHLKLRRCVWSQRFSIRDHRRNPIRDSNFCEKVRSAVNLCPFVHELVIHVRQNTGYEAVRFLKQLTLLRINFCNCKGDFVPDFIAFLQEIGPQLKHLSVLCYRRIPVDIVCDCCPHLQSLEIDGSTLVKNSPECSRNLLLKRLRLCCSFEVNNKEGLFFLLSNCRHLEELFLEDADCVNDALLMQIFERNPLTELKMFCIEDCCLTREGYEMFLRKATAIETFLIISYEVYFYDVNKLFKDPNVRCLKSVDFKYKEFFHSRLNENRF